MGLTNRQTGLDCYGQVSQGCGLAATARISVVLKRGIILLLKGICIPALVLAILCAAPFVLIIALLDQMGEGDWL